MRMDCGLKTFMAVVTTALVFVIGADSADAIPRGASGHIAREVSPSIYKPEEIPESSAADAAYNLGVKYYRYGRGHIRRAVEWFRQAAELGSAQGQYRMGVAHELGEGVAKDYTEALKWYRLSAIQKNKDGQYGLGSLYANGYGVERDYAEAAKWYKLSAAQGMHYAQYELGRLFLEGNGVEQSYQEAYFWFALGARKIDESMKKRDEVAKHLTDEQVQALRRRLMEWEPVQHNDEFNPPQ